MQSFLRAATLSALLGAAALGGCASSGYYGDGAPQTQLSQCMRNAIVGAGIGAAIGAVTAPDDNRIENAAIGAAVGGAGTYGACRYLSGREQQRIENAYYQALSTGVGVTQSWQADDGSSRSLQVAPPGPAQRPDCRTVRATLSGGGIGRQQLPAETYCRAAPKGSWAPS
jgi:surface antigen